MAREVSFVGGEPRVIYLTGVFGALDAALGGPADRIEVTDAAVITQTGQIHALDDIADVEVRPSPGWRWMSWLFFYPLTFACSAFGIFLWTQVGPSGGILILLGLAAQFVAILIFFSGYASRSTIYLRFRDGESEGLASGSPRHLNLVREKIVRVLARPRSTDTSIPVEAPMGQPPRVHDPQEAPVPVGLGESLRSVWGFAWKLGLLAIFVAPMAYCSYHMRSPPAVYVR